MAKTKRVAVIGGGILGLTLSYYLAQAGFRVDIFEKNSGWGGLASGMKLFDTYIEKYYHHWFRGDKAIQELIKQLGISDRLFFATSSMGVYYQGKTHPFSTSLDLLRFKPMSLINRLRTGLVALKLQNQQDYSELEKIPALDWCRKNFGEEATRITWEPMLKGKFGDHYHKIPMSWLWARYHDRATTRPHPLAKEKLGYMQGGFQTLIDALVDSLANLNVKLIAESKVVNHNFEDGLHTLKLEKDGQLFQSEYDLVISTLPGPVFTKVFNVSQEVRDRIDSINYLGATCMLLVSRKSLTPYYWLNVNDSEFPFMAVIEHTNLIEKSNYQDRVLIYIAKYLDTDNPLFSESPQNLFDQYIPYLQKINRDFNEDWIEESYFFKAGYAQHIVTVDYEIPPYETGIPGLYFSNFTQIYPHDRGTNYAVAQAQQLSNLVIENHGA